MSKGKAMTGGSTSHTPCMAGRGRHDELPDGWGKSVLPLQRVNYSNSRVLGYGQLGASYSFFFYTSFAFYIKKKQNVSHSLI